MCIFALARTTFAFRKGRGGSCELLQNVYLCISTYNFGHYLRNQCYVVNCFKMCIFALARTTDRKTVVLTQSCELLQNVYLCISTYNIFCTLSLLTLVVNCFKMCIFALARTTAGCE